MEQILSVNTAVNNTGYKMAALGASGALPLGEYKLEQISDYTSFFSGRAGQAVKVVSSHSTLNVLQEGKFEAQILNLINASSKFSNYKNRFVPRSKKNPTYSTITNTYNAAKKFDDVIQFAYPTGYFPESLRNTVSVGDELSVFGNVANTEDERISATSTLGAPMFGANPTIEYRTNSYANDVSFLNGLSMQRISVKDKSVATTEFTDDDGIRSFTKRYGDSIIGSYFTKEEVTEGLRPVTEPTGILTKDLRTYVDYGDRPENNFTQVMVQGTMNYLSIDFSNMPVYTYKDTSVSPAVDVEVEFDYDSKGGSEVARGGGYLADNTAADFRSTPTNLNPPGLNKYDFATVLLVNGVTPLLSRGLDGYNTGFTVGASVSFNPNGIPYVYNSAFPTVTTDASDNNRFINGTDLRNRHNHKILEVSDWFSKTQEIDERVRGFAVEPILEDALKEAFLVHFRDVQNVPITEVDAINYVTKCAKAGVLQNVKVAVDFNN